MNRNSKGRAWYDKIYRKLASQGNVSSGLNSVKDEPEKLREEQMEGDGFKEKLSDSVLIDEKLEEYSDCDRTATTSRSHTDPVSSQSTHQTPESFRTPITCDDDTFVSVSGISRDVSNLIPFATETPASPVQEKMANTRSFSNNSVKGNQDEFFIEDFDVGPMDTIDLYDMTFREDPSDFDDNLLYAMRDRTKQLRSFKRKIMDAIKSKRRREKEYEQLAIWFGDADMGCDLVNDKEQSTTSIDSKSSQTNVPVVSEDSEWEIL